MKELDVFIDNINEESMKEHVFREIVVSKSIFEKVKNSLVNGYYRGYKITTRFS
jgi:hypothetical protein